MVRRIAFVSSLLLLGTMACSPAPDADNAAATGPDPAMGTEDTAAVDTANMPGTADQNAADAGAAPAGAGSEGEALAFLQAVNAHEIAAAEQAQGKQVDGSLREYVDMLHMEHSRNQTDTRALSDSSGVAITDTPDVDALKAKGQAELQRLSALTGDEYESAFVAAMIKDHTEALATIDNRLMAAASSGPIRDHLTSTRAAIAKHLEAAQALQSS